MSHNWADKVTYQILRRSSMQKGICLILGATDTGKTTLAVALASHVASNGPVGFIDADRGCRTKITVKVDGDVRKLWKNWIGGIHRQTCYGDITRELGFFCRFQEIKMVNEVA